MDAIVDTNIDTSAIKALLGFNDEQCSWLYGIIFRMLKRSFFCMEIPDKKLVFIEQGHPFIIDIICCGRYPSIFNTKSGVDDLFKCSWIDSRHDTIKMLDFRYVAEAVFRYFSEKIMDYLEIGEERSDGYSIFIINPDKLNMSLNSEEILKNHFKLSLVKINWIKNMIHEIFGD